MRWWALASLVRGDGACAAGKNAPNEPTTWRESNAALPDCSPQGASATLGNFRYFKRSAAPR